MANKKLRGIVWPNLPNDTYLLDSGEVDYSAEASYRDGTVGKALHSKANVDGSYSDLTAGNAEQLVSNIRANDKTPYLFRTSGGSVDIGDREYINGIVGVSLPWNQLVKSGNFADISGWHGSYASLTASENELTVAPQGTPTYIEAWNINTALKAIANHKYFISCDIYSDQWKSTNDAALIRFGGVWANRINGSTLTNGAWNTVAFIYQHSTDTTTAIEVAVRKYPQGEGVITAFKARNYVAFDLTQMFDSTIADYIYSLETANAGAGVAWFKKLFPKPYYAYDSGSLKSVEGLVSHDTTGFNQWDEEWELGDLNTNTGANYADSTRIRSKNYIPILPSTTYYLNSPNNVTVCYYDADKTYIERGTASQTKNTTFTTPSNAHYMRFSPPSAYGTTYNHDICINFHWDGSRDGEYEPYVKHSYPLDSDVTLRGKLMLDANNNLYANGDVYPPSGEVQRNWAEVDLGTLDWTLLSVSEWNCFYTTSLSKTRGYNFVCSKYSISTVYNTATDKIIDGNPNSTALYIRDTAYADAASFKTAMSGVMLAYEKATPTTESADPYTSPQIVDDFGTEQYVLDDSAFPVPVGHDTDYPVNLVAKLEMSPNSPSGGDGDYIVRQTNGENSYVPLVIEDALPTIPSTTGSYKLTVTVAEGSDPVLSWESE